MKIFSPKLKYLTRRSSAFLLDYIFFISLFGVVISSSTSLSLGLVLPDDTVNFAFIATILLLLFFYMMKDSIKGISPGKWCLGLMIRNANSPDIIPSLWVLFVRNYIALTAHFLEFPKIIFDKNNQRFADIYFVTVVIDNPDKAELKLRALTASFLLLYFFFSFSEILFAVLF